MTNSNYHDVPLVKYLKCFYKNVVGYHKILYHKASWKVYLEMFTRKEPRDSLAALRLEIYLWDSLHLIGMTSHCHSNHMLRCWPLVTLSVVVEVNIRGKVQGRTSIKTNTGTKVLSPWLLRLTCVMPTCKEKRVHLTKKEIVLKIVILIVWCLCKLSDFNLLVECT